MPAYDLITMGRISMDLFSENVGAPFRDIRSFSASVGGTPTNVAVGASRLGLKTALLTAVGDDLVGQFVRRTLADEMVDTRYIPEKVGTRTGLALLGIEPPDHFPLTFYRQDPADIHLTIDDVQAVPLAQSAALLLTGTALSRGNCREATLFAAEEARRLGVTVYLDLDLRPDQWPHLLAYGVWMRRLLPQVQIVFGTEEEFFAALGSDVDRVLSGAPLGRAEHRFLAEALPGLLARCPALEALILKRGPAGVTVFLPGRTPLEVGGFPVAVLNTVGAGDAFASAFIYARRRGYGWTAAARLGNAGGALVVTRHGCATAMPYESELQQFVQAEENDGTPS